ncbi:hypothetical protein PGT21_027645 [Puccinia graminis f. sp. tritici]|uniref:Uncharacterized protein n=1 Tax=Puccinia graminis f. sp. tritici TaxID=56615 RepID=A0A5B0PM14_PUCGR|nr:hypothetical protein PGT21_027645 [Puccinia graminis f. sp. tritici]
MGFGSLRRKTNGLIDDGCRGLVTDRLVSSIYCRIGVQLSRTQVWSVAADVAAGCGLKVELDPQRQVSQQADATAD